jgi:predicted alpha/beta-fold hydrolase
LKRRMRRKGQCWPGKFDVSLLSRVRTVRGFDEAYTAPYFGFNGAEDYYHRASSMRIIERIRVPALIITSQDDPFVPYEPFLDPKVTGNKHIELALCEHGGHCGFVGEASAGDDGYWAETRIVDFVSHQSASRQSSVDD